MKITINTDVLSKYNLTLKEFLVLLIGYYELGYTVEHNALMKRGLVEKNLFSQLPPILSDNTRDLIAKILAESDDRLQQSGITDFEGLAEKLMAIYPDGNKAGTTHKWRGSVDEIAQKLRVIAARFPFTEEEAIAAVKEYVDTFKDYKFMQLLKYFLLKTTNTDTGCKEMSSMFMTIIENNREQYENNN